MLAQLMFVLLAYYAEHVHPFDPCGSTYFSEFGCKEAYHVENLPCFWNDYSNKCETILCSKYSDYYQCNAWNKMYGCEWYSLPTSPYGTLNICYSECLKYMDIVFTIDVSSSLMGNSINQQYTRDYIITIMKFFWNIQTTIIDNYFIDEPNQYGQKTAEYTRFGVIYFATHSATYMDLTYGKTLDTYINKIDKLFNGSLYNILPFSPDDTNIVSALHDTYTLFKNSESYYFKKKENGLHTKRLNIMITDGIATYPSSGLDPCLTEYNFARKYFDGIYNEPIELYIALINGEENLFTCFEEYGVTTVQPLPHGYSRLGDAIPGMKLPNHVCPVDTIAPTNYPTYYPTDEPTRIPTKKPTNRPTNKPTNKPTDRPTKWPTKWPTNKPSDKPTNKPSDKPTNKPTYKPTENPSNKPTSQPINYYYPIDTTTTTISPSCAPTKSPVGWWNGHWTHHTSRPTYAPTKRPTSWWAVTKPGHDNSDDGDHHHRHHDHE